MARKKARDQGADDAIITNTNGNIACGTTSNVFIEENGQLVTPPLSEWVEAIDTASWYTLKQAKCLSRALTLYLLMKWCGYEATLHIGVAKANTNIPASESDGQPTTIEAHAWIEHSGQVVLGQIRDLDRFTLLPSIEQMK